MESKNKKLKTFIKFGIVALLIGLVIISAGCTSNTTTNQTTNQTTIQPSEPVSPVVEDNKGTSYVGDWEMSFKNNHYNMKLNITEDNKFTMIMDALDIVNESESFDWCEYGDILIMKGDLSEIADNEYNLDITHVGIERNGDMMFDTDFKMDMYKIQYDNKKDTIKMICTDNNSSIGLKRVSL